MSEKTILVIDDSTTIRKLVDAVLSGEGYTTILAASAEQGIAYAQETHPDLILLDHQLPGTTGYEVCQQLLASPTLSQIPVVASSTLRKKAYVEYTDCDNVVDMLPKPYTEELLKTTIANALETAAMIVSSQSHGTAVPEVIEESEDATLAGLCSTFSLRELLDFLNNGSKQGVLEVEAERIRLWFYLDKGRIQGVSATGITAAEVADITRLLPDALTNLAAVLKLTMGGRGTAEFDGFMQLLDQKVLDPRLTARLLRFQAAMLVRLAFQRNLKAFRFHSGRQAPVLHRQLPIDSSLLALLVEQAIHCDLAELPADDDCNRYVRRSIRGQNLDRAGLAARHMKILNLLTEPKSAAELATSLGWEADEVRRVLRGFVLAELVEESRDTTAGKIVVFEPNPGLARQLRSAFETEEARYQVKVVRDAMAFQLLLKRSNPDAVVFAADDEETREVVRNCFERTDVAACRIAVTGDDKHEIDWRSHLGFAPAEVIARPCTPQSIIRVVARLCATDQAADNRADAAVAAPAGTALDTSLSTPAAEATE